jgi:hypothetical protein
MQGCAWGWAENTRKMNVSKKYKISDKKKRKPSIKMNHFGILVGGDNYSKWWKERWWIVNVEQVLKLCCCAIFLAFPGF